MKFLKQSTAAAIPFGPFLDKTDGVTLEVGAGIITSIDHATTGIFLSKNGGAGAIRHQAVTPSTLDAYGMFLVTLDTTDTNAVGRLRVMMAEAATFLPVWDDFMIVNANVYDSLFAAAATDYLKVDTIQVNDAAQTATLDTIKAETVLIVADTGELQADWANGGRLDLLIDAIKVPTDKLVFTVANQVDANLQSVNDVALVGDGAVTPWGP